MIRSNGLRLDSRREGGGEQGEKESKLLIGWAVILGQKCRQGR
jgi:hypothetical protein